MNQQIPLVEDVQAAAEAATVYTADARTRIIKATVCNTDTSTRTLALWIVPQGGARGGTNQILVAKSILAGKTEELYDLEGHVIGIGGMLDAQGSVAAKLSLRVSGIQLT